MRKAIFCLLLAVLAVICLSLPAFSKPTALAAAGSTYRGDINEDGKVDVFDLLELLKSLAGQNNTERKRQIADVNASGAVDVFDLLGMLKVLSGTSQPGIIYWVPEILGLDKLSASEGDTLGIAVSSIDQEKYRDSTKVYIGELGVSIIQFGSDTIKVQVPAGFTGGYVKVIVARDTTNLKYLNYQIKHEITALAGGKVEMSNGASVDIPAGALPDNKAITISQVSLASAAELKMVADSSEVIMEFGPAGTVFEVPVRIALPMPAGITESDTVEVLYYDESAGSWGVMTGAERDDSKRVLYADVLHFSIYKAAKKNRTYVRTTFELRGSVKTGGLGLVGVSVRITGNGVDRTVTTGTDGGYSFAELTNGTYSISFSSVSYSFIQSSPDATINGSDVILNPVTAALIVLPPLTYSISGSVTCEGNALSGVSVRITGNGVDRTVTTGTDGGYSFTELTNGTYSISFSSVSYSFNQSNPDATINGSDVILNPVTAALIVLPPLTYSISGSVTCEGNALSGVSVRLTGTDKDTTAITSTNGDYTFTGIANGTYTVTPSKSGYNLSPTNRSVTANGANTTVADFIATVQVAFNLTLVSYELSPVAMFFAPGGSYTARYQINNPNNSAMQVKLDLRYRTSAGVYGEFEPTDTTLTIQPGAAWYERVARVPASLSDGALDVAWYLLTTSNSQIMATSYISGMVTVFSLNDTTVVQGITFVSIPGGKCQMGQLGFIVPLHQVTVSAFKMGRYEITQAQYQAIVGTNPSGFTGDLNRPVEWVFWSDAVTFCNKLSEAAGLQPCYNLSTGVCDFTKNGYRLPTEAEWEYACRAGTTTRYYTGDSESALDKAGWYKNNSGSTTHKVGLKQPNAFGLYDMHGNVGEWCNDWYELQSSESAVDPQGPASGSDRIVRGGSYLHSPDGCLSGVRFPTSQPRGIHMGFRVVSRSGVTSQEFINPNLEGYELSPEAPTLLPGGSFTARYQINNPSSTSMQVKLDLHYRTSAGAYGEFEPADTTLTIQPGTDWYERAARVPAILADSALLDVAWYLLTTSNSQIASTSYISGKVTIISPGYTTVTFVSIPGGTFQMGQVGVTEPVHQVTVSAFKMGRYEITQAQYLAVAGSNPSFFAGDWFRPVELVSWSEAVTFCNKLSEAAGLQPCYNLSTWACDFTKDGYRLPTEAEWEYACRAGTTTNYYTGDSESDLDNAGWYNGNSGGFTHTVGFKQPNAFGLCDMHGNVGEWCNDWYGDYSSSSQTDPNGSSSGSYRVIRGGGYEDISIVCQSAFRSYWDPFDMRPYIGFRVVSQSGGTSQELINPGLEGYELSPAAPTLPAGGSFTARYQINNPNNTFMQVKLDLRYRTSAGEYGEFEPISITLTIQPGTAWYERAARVPASLEDGALDVAWYLFTTSNSQIASTSYISGKVTIKSGISFEDTTVVQGITFVSIPGGTFQMGQVGVAEPVHQVTVSAFKMGRYEITQAQYQAVVGSNPSYYTGDLNRPVETVSWLYAVTFCNKLSKLAGLDSCYSMNTRTFIWSCDFSKNGFRLPTEAEWEYACRAGTNTNYYTGHSESDLDKAGWYNGNSGVVTTHPVGLKQPNALGLYDMHGNVGEWCNDYYEGYYSWSQINPKGPASGSGRIVRGGSWESNAYNCRSAYRFYVYQSAGSLDTGFRVVSR